VALGGGVMGKMKLENDMWMVQIGIEGIEEQENGKWSGESLPVTVTYTGHEAEQEETWAGFLISREGIASLEASLDDGKWRTGGCDLWLTVRNKKKREES
jgi:hypothetical protein